MSRKTQILLGAIFCFATAIFVFSGITEYDTRKKILTLLLSTFSLVVALAFLHVRSRFVTLRLIGITLFILYSVYAYQDFGTPNMRRALLGFGLIGIPSGILAITGGYPSWGRLGVGFQQPKPTDDAASPNRRS